ncbi:hypothetical protein K435DRAFT_856899 [Dendrothele bispora CBS 962.96]|uniref:F-box domain-containing protein n=1 Tax=Dendrothele bispora (strain CBS 962.96) TaxID=1314807 RepID=A0A4S8M7N9_DENBC|nr:hypothetical protein K435DRAFT_856899 [Dendrothele bispora CBS 962.96]
MSRSSLVTAVLFQPELFRLVVAYADIHDYLSWRYTCRAMHHACEDILHMDFRNEMCFWCPDRSAVSMLTKQMEQLETIVVGAAALALLRLHTPGPMSTLHLLCSWADMDQWTALATQFGWMQCARTSNEHLEVIRLISTKGTIITIQGVKSGSPIEFLTQAPESAHFTFVSSRGVFCGYPNLTLDNVTFPLRENAQGYHLGWDCLTSFRYDDILLTLRVDCFNLDRSWSDRQSLRIPWTQKDSLLPSHRLTNMSFLEICYLPNVLLRILERLPFRDWISVSNTCQAAHNDVQTCFECLFETRIADFVRYDDLHKFIGLLHYSDSVIVGSLPLAMLRLTPWAPGKELIVYSPLGTKGIWQRRFGWRLISELAVGEEGGIHTVQSYSFEETANIKLIYTAGPRVLGPLAKASETALFTFMSSTNICTAYPLLTLEHRTVCANISLDGYTAGAECLTRFTPIASLPEKYAGPRKWNDSQCLSFRYTPFTSDFVTMGGDDNWELTLG